MCSWVSGGIFRDLLFETVDHLAFCLAAPLETINRPAEEQVQWSHVPKCRSAVPSVTLHTSSVKGGSWEKVALALSCNLKHLWWWVQSQLVIPPLSCPELLLCSLGSAALPGRHRDGGTRKMIGPALPKNCERIGALSLWCNVQQIVVMLLSVPCWLADVEDQQYCRKKHVNDLKKKSLMISYSSSLFKYRLCSVACFLIPFLRCAVSWRMVLVCMVTSLIPCYLITPAPLLWNVLVRCHVKGMNIHL